MDTSQLSPTITVRSASRDRAGEARHRSVRLSTSPMTRRTDVLVAEDLAAYRTGNSQLDDQQAGADTAVVTTHAQLMQGLSQAVDALIARSLDELDEPDLKTELHAVEAERRRLEARQSRLAASPPPCPPAPPPGHVPPPAPPAAARTWPTATPDVSSSGS